jgi:hypothetical protein
MEINGVSYGIEKDESFRRLYALIAAHGPGQQPRYRVTSTITGVFFAGHRQEAGFKGYGHLGCCSLLVITAVSDVESSPPADLSVRGIVSMPDGKPAAGVPVFADVPGGTPVLRQQAATDENGEFRFSNAGPFLRVESPHYRPVTLPTLYGGIPGSLMVIRLEDARQSDWILPTCSQLKDGLSRIGSRFRFALPEGMQAERMDIRDGSTYFVFPAGKSAPFADLIIEDQPQRLQDWTAMAEIAQIEQRWIKDSQGNVLGEDARGRLADGGHWRSMTFDGQVSATYQLSSGGPLSLHDAVIDSACRGQTLK